MFSVATMGKVCGCFVLVNVANMGVQRSYHGEGVWLFCVSLCTVFIFILCSAIILCMPGCLAVLAWLR